MGLRKRQQANDTPDAKKNLDAQRGAFTKQNKKGYRHPQSAGKLYICPTPIGNLGDVSLRVLETLARVDTVCAEDTRVTAKLLAAYDIEKRIERLDEELLSKRMDSIIERVLQGEHIAYCSDAGMPGVSDPGLRLVDAAHKAGLAFEVLPGPSASITAYVASGFSNPHFFFGGFLPRKKADCIESLTQLKALDAVLLYYESPQRLLASLACIAEVFPYRRIAICRELTKLHEEVVRGSSKEVLAEFEQRTQDRAIKGEIVIVIDSEAQEEREEESACHEEQAYEEACRLTREENMTTKDIARRIQAEYGIPRNLAYEIAVSSTAKKLSSVRNEPSTTSESPEKKDT